MSMNPEFQRQLWLNWRPSLIGWSLGLSALALAVPLATGDAKNRLHFVAITAIALMWMAAAIYGSALAARSLREEAVQNTWDWQRLSALSPWQMAWGKLLGATAPAWLYVLWFALVANFLSATLDQLGLGMLSLHSMLLAVLWGLGLQAWAMVSVLLSWHTQSRAGSKRFTAPLPFLCLFLLPGPMFSRLASSFFNKDGGAVLWWGMDLGNKGVAYIFGFVILGLGLLALWRQLCTRLDVRTLPWAWPLGLCVTGFTVGGLFSSSPIAFLSWTCCFALVGTAYVALQSMDDGLRNWRQVQWCAAQGRWRDALQALPLWPVSWLLAAITCGLWLLWPQNLGIGLLDLPAAPLSAAIVTLQVLRDAAILTGFALLAGRLKSPMAAFWITMLVLNALLPLLGVALLHNINAIAVIQPVLSLIWNHGEQELGLTPWIAMGLHLLLALGWLAYIFRQRVLGYASETSAQRG